MNPAEQRQVKGQMNKIANQFSSIEQVTGQYLGQGRKHPVTGSGEVSFQEILARKQSEQEPEAQITFIQISTVPSLFSRTLTEAAVSE